MITILLHIFEWFIVFNVMMAFAEYFIHRYLMHRQVLNFRGLKWVFEEHAIDHHFHGRNNKNIDLPVYYHLIIGSPLIIFLALVDPVALVPLMIVFWMHSYLWTKIHRATHGLESNWISQTRWYKTFENHHLMHHKYPGKNFGVVYIFMDYVFGTAKYE